MDKARLANVLAVILTVMFMASLYFKPAETLHAIGFMLAVFGLTSFAVIIYAIFRELVRAMMGMDQ